MKPTLSGVWQKSNKSLKTVWLIVAGFSALYFGAIKPHLGSSGIAAERGAGLASVEWDPISLWRAPLYKRVFEASESQMGASIGALKMVADSSGEGRTPQAALTTYLSKNKSEASDADRKMERMSSMDLVAKDPADSSEKIRQLAEHLGGFLVKSVTNGQGVQGLSSKSAFLRSISKRRVLKSGNWACVSRVRESKRKMLHGSMSIWMPG